MLMNKLKKYFILGAVFVSVLGTFLHFAYSLSEESLIVGLFTPVSESVWEHTKLIFFPMLLCAFFFKIKLKKDYPCAPTSLIFGALLGIILIISLFYTYSGIIGKNFAFADISIFFISVIWSFFASYKKALFCKTKKYTKLLIILAVIVIILFFIFTITPPVIPLFVAP